MSPSPGTWDTMVVHPQESTFCDVQHVWPVAIQEVALASTR